MPLTRCERNRASKTSCAVLVSRPRPLRRARYPLAAQSFGKLLVGLFYLRYLKRRKARVCVLVVHHYCDYRVRRSGLVFFNESKHEVSLGVFDFVGAENLIFLIKRQRLALEFFLLPS